MNAYFTSIVRFLRLLILTGFLSSSLQGTTLPDPIAEFASLSEPQGFSGYYSYRVRLTNWEAFPEEMFAPAPHLPPCGSNTNAGRTWVYVYAYFEGEYISGSGFCGVSARPSNGDAFWIAFSADAERLPDQLQIVLWDREENSVISSQLVPAPFVRLPLTRQEVTGPLPPGKHNVLIAGFPATLIVGEAYDPNHKTFLAYYLHGDEGNFQAHDAASSPVRNLIDRCGLIYVAPQAPEAPNSPGIYPWDGRSGGDQQGNGLQIRAVLDYVHTHYNVDRRRVLGAGASGGSWFHDAVFLPLYGDSHPSHFILCCGAAGQSATFPYYQAASALSQNASALAANELLYTIGTEDFLFSNAETSMTTYQSLGFRVRTDFLPGVGHCQFNLGEKITQYWAETLSTFDLSDLALEIAPDLARKKIQLHWQARPGRSYSIKTSHLTTPSDSWQESATIAATSDNRQHFFEAAMANNEPKKFYRIEIEVESSN